MLSPFAAIDSEFLVTFKVKVEMLSCFIRTAFAVETLGIRTILAGVAWPAAYFLNDRHLAATNFGAT